MGRRIKGPPCFVCGPKGPAEAELYSRGVKFFREASGSHLRVCDEHVAKIEAGEFEQYWFDAERNQICRKFRSG